ncbi:MAG TPA: fasciclin domain-containing protein [Gaiellaceae bacterium]|nr:fasciclin domain-containing protein [Gaiellaceae bacterium]
MKRILALSLGLLLVAGGLALVAARARSAQAAPSAQKNIVQTAVAAGQFKTLVSLVKQAGLAKALSGTQKLTVFAPTDAAFAKVPKSTLESLAAHPAKLKAVLLYHVVKGEVLSGQVVKLTSAKTLEGQPVRIHVANGKVFVNNAQVVKANVLASNGVIHVVNRVLLPPMM